MKSAPTQRHHEPTSALDHKRPLAAFSAVGAKPHRCTPHRFRPRLGTTRAFEAYKVLAQFDLPAHYIVLQSDRLPGRLELASNSSRQGDQRALRKTGTVTRAHRPVHERSSYVTHDRRGLFEGLPSPLCVGRYHSLVVELKEPCTPQLMVTARLEEGEIMALAHRNQATYGVQFHPESILTQHGHIVLVDFLRLAKTSPR